MKDDTKSTETEAKRERSARIKKKKAAEKTKTETKTEANKPKTSKLPAKVKGNSAHLSSEEELPSSSSSTSSPVTSRVQYSPFNLLRLNGPPEQLIPKLNSDRGAELRSTVFEYYKNDMKQEVGKSKKLSNGQKVPVRISTPARYNLKCDRENPQSFRLTENGKRASLVHWYPADEDTCNKEHIDGLQSPSKYFLDDKSTNDNGTVSGTKNNMCTNVSTLNEPQMEVVDLTDTDFPFINPDVMITKFKVNQSPNLKSKTRRNNCPIEEITLN